ncbi:MAG: hypothetical protein ACWA5R_12390 [bacterium]
MKIFKNNLKQVTGMLILALLSNQAFAENGIFEINQDCALLGCFSGDSAGFPVTISETGSYQLTSDLSVTDLNQGGIDVTANDVRVNLNLNGHSIKGVATCAQDANGIVTSCDSGNGVGINGDVADYIKIENGFVSGFPGIGVSVRTNAYIKNMDVSFNGSIGIYGDIYTTAFRGQNLKTIGNAGTGIVAPKGSILQDVISQRNGFSGVFTEDGSVLSSISAKINGQSGITISADSLLEYGSSENNGSRSTSDAGQGILGNSNSLVIESTSSSNFGAGIEILTAAGSYGSIGHSYMKGNYTGGASPAWPGVIQIEGNFCETNTTCP